MLTETIVRLAEKLKGFKDASGLSERELAEKSGVPYGTLHMYISGYREPTFSNLAKICIALDIAMDEFADCDEVTGKTILARSWPATA